MYDDSNKENHSSLSQDYFLNTQIVQALSDLAKRNAHKLNSKNRNYT